MNIIKANVGNKMGGIKPHDDQKMKKLIEEKQKLFSDNEKLVKDNEELVAINEELGKENEELGKENEALKARVFELESNPKNSKK